MMKKILLLTFLIAILGAFCSPVSAQTSQQVTVDMADLTPAQRAKVEADALIAKQQEQLAVYEKKIETFGQWVGVGGEIGSAVEEGLTAVVDVADKFGKTDVGKFTLVMIAWKVMGTDLVRIFLGLLFIGMFTWLLIYSFKRTCIDRRVVIKEQNPGFMKYPKLKEYELIEPLFGEGEGLGAIRMLHLVMFLIGIWITYAIMF